MDELSTSGSGHEATPRANQDPNRDPASRDSRIQGFRYLIARIRSGGFTFRHALLQPHCSPVRVHLACTCRQLHVPVVLVPLSGICAKHGRYPVIVVDDDPDDPDDSDSRFSQVPNLWSKRHWIMDAVDPRPRPSLAPGTLGH